MKKIIFLLMLCSLVSISHAQETKQAKNKVILLVSEQNIQSPQRAWWVSEIDLSVTEARLAQKLIEGGYVVIEPSDLNQIIKQERAFRILNISEKKAIKLGKLSRADYIVLGKAVASSGVKVPQSNMVSCFANITAKLIRAKDGKVVAYLDTEGNSAHMDVITGGKEALVRAGEDLGIKIVDALNKGGIK